MDSLVSVIVPIYGVEKYLDKCVESIVNQTYTNLEIILVDDESPDNCPKMCDEWAKKDSRVKVIHKKNGGQSDARNAGIKIATGSLIGFVDGDDRITEKMYETLVKQLKDNDSDISCCDFLYISEDGEILYEGDAPLTPKNILMNSSEAEQQLIIGEILKQQVWDKLYRREVIDGVMFKQGCWHEDVYWSFEVIGRAKKVSFTNEKLYYYLQRSSSIMGEKYSRKRFDALDAMMQRNKYMSEHFPELYSLSLQKYAGACMYHYQLILNDKSVDSDKSMRKNIVNRVKKIDLKEASEIMRLKEWIMFRMFRIMPGAVCTVRNLFGIGR